MSNCNYKGACAKPLTNGVCTDSNCEHNRKGVRTTKSWKKEGLTLKVMWVRDHFCGYVTFPKRPLREKGYDGIATYVPVHGGITFAKPEKNGNFTYGFDCAHSGDYVDYGISGFSPPSGHKWTEEEVVVETEKMARGIILAKKYELRYLRNISNKGKAKVLDEYYKELGEKFNMGDNFGASLNLLGGKL